MKLLSLLLRHCLLLLVLAALLAAALALQTAPLVPQPAAISPGDVAQARNFLRRNDPRSTPPGQLRQVQISEPELALLLNYLASRYPQAAARLTLHDGQALASASLALGGPFWLNVRARLLQNGGLPRLADVRLGRLPLPDWLSGWARERLLARLAAHEEAVLARQMVKQLSLHRGRVQLVYEWQPDNYRRLLDSLVPAPQQARLRAYSDLVLDFSRRHPGTQSLAAVLPPLFALAQQRSLGGGDAAAENRAALLALAAHATGRGLGALLPSARDWPQPAAGFELHLYGRPDFPMHWLVSAALAAEAGGPLADAVGIYKEIADTRDGSGFSFNDIAADRAGSRLGQLAVSRAQQLQQRLAAGVSEAELLPDISDLPEFLSAAEFRRRYGSTDSPAYRAMMGSIEARLDTLPLLN